MPPDFSRVVEMMAAQGVQRFYIKPLAENDNSKNQPYMGNQQAVQIFPVGDFHSVTGGKRANFHVDLLFSWLSDDGSVCAAPNTKLIYYPDYPEVRLSGFLLGCRRAPNNLMNVRMAGRVMVFGIIPGSDEQQGRVIAYVAPAGSPLANEFGALGALQEEGVFRVLAPADGTVASAALRAVQALLPSSSGAASRSELCRQMGDINRLGWIASKRLVNASTGAVAACNAANCGGYTLEAELGITANGRSEPDWRGWEVKQYGVQNFANYRAKSAVSVMVPQADGGYRAEQGFQAFMNRYGYPDKTGRADRLNFGGQFRVGNSITPGAMPLALMLEGYNAATGVLTDATGGIVVLEADGTVALRWSYAKVLEHWARKHDRAAYVPSLSQDTPRSYAYGDKIRVCETTSPNFLLKALYEQKVWLDPGLRISTVSASDRKERHQFRIKAVDLPSLYSVSEFIDVI